MTIEITGLTKTYKGDVQALKGIDLTIGEGMFGLLGPNGAGKTTLMRVLSGLLNMTSGGAIVLGEDITTREGRENVKKKLGYLPQELGLYPHLTGREFLHYMGILKGMSQASIREKQVEQLLEEVRLTDVADRRLKTYSGGMKRRIGIAQAMLGSPKLLIVDEPTAGLDPEERIRFRNLLSEMALRCTVILSTHIIEDISHSCNDLAVISGGQVLFHGTPQTLIQGAKDQVWSIVTDGERPNGNVSIVSTLQIQEGVQYRVLGKPAENYQATALPASLEDGYMLLMREAKGDLA